MAKSTYTKEQKARALELLDTESVWAAVNEIGCTHVTVYRWHAEHVRTLKSTPEQEQAEAEQQVILRNRLRRRLIETAMSHVDRSDAARSAKDAKDYMIAAGTALDKYRLEMGEATARTFVEGHDDIDRSVAQLVEEMAGRSKASTA